jgi:hypothetical protein
MWEIFAWSKAGSPIEFVVEVLLLLRTGSIHKKVELGVKHVLYSIIVILFGVCF